MSAENPLHHRAVANLDNNAETANYALKAIVARARAEGRLTITLTVDELDAWTITMDALIAVAQAFHRLTLKLARDAAWREL